MASSTYHEPTNVRRKYACPGSNRYNRRRSRSCNQASMGIKKKLEMETTKGSSLWGRGMLMLTPLTTLASILTRMLSFLLGGASSASHAVLTHGGVLLLLFLFVFLHQGESLPDNENSKGLASGAVATAIAGAATAAATIVASVAMADSATEEKRIAATAREEKMNATSARRAAAASAAR